MKRAAFIFKIKLELKSEYKKAHDEIWPEMVEAIRKSGIKNSLLWTNLFLSKKVYLFDSTLSSYSLTILIQSVSSGTSIILQ